MIIYEEFFVYYGQNSSMKCWYSNDVPKLQVYREMKTLFILIGITVWN